MRTANINRRLAMRAIHDAVNDGRRLTVDDQIAALDLDAVSTKELLRVFAKYIFNQAAGAYRRRAAIENGYPTGVFDGESIVDSLLVIDSEIIPTRVAESDEIKFDSNRLSNNNDGRLASEIERTKLYERRRVVSPSGRRRRRQLEAFLATE